MPGPSGYTPSGPDASAEPFEVDAKQLAAASAQKEQAETPKVSKSSKPSGDILEVDLHIASLMDNINGLSSRDILQYQLDKFKETMNSYIRFKGQRIVFIHGKGDGVLRAAILKELNRMWYLLILFLSDTVNVVYA